MDAEKIMNAETWDAKHAKELNFQKLKRTRRFVEAVQQGSIPGSQVTQDKSLT